MAAKRFTSAKTEAFDGEAILVCCVQPGGRRRAGYQFGPEPVLVMIADLDDATLEALGNDPFLSIKSAPKPELDTKTE